MMSEQVPPEEASPVRRLLTALVALVCRFPLPTLVLSLALCGLSVYAAATRLQYLTQRNDLLSPHKDYQQRWRQYLAEFGDDDDIVVVVQGDNRQQMRAALERLASQVRQQPDRFDRLFFKVDLRPLHSRALMFLPAEEIRTIQQNLGGMGPLLEWGPFGWSGLTLLSLFQEANHRVSQLAPDYPLSAADDQFLTQLLALTRSARATLADPAAYTNPWGSLMARPPDQKDLLAEPQYFFSGDGTLAFLLVRPIKETGSFTPALKSVEAMRGIVAATRPDFPGVAFGLTGLPVLETDEMAAAESDTRLASWLAFGGVAVLFLLVYRRLWYPLLTVATLLVGTAWAMGWLTLTVGHLNILSGTFAVMLIGMGDYGVLWVMRYEQARRQGTEVRAALLHTTTHVAIGNLTAAMTLALAFFAAMLADFRAVAELGWIAGCGVLLCAFACFTLLPSLLMLFDRRQFSPCGSTEANDPTSPPVLRVPWLSPPQCEEAWLPRLVRQPRWVLGGGLVLALVLGVCATRVKYDHNLLHLQPQNLDSVKWELTLIEHTAGASWHALSFTTTPEEALALKKRYEQLPEVSRVVEVASLVPRDQELKLGMLRDIRRRLGNLPRRGAVIPHARPVVETLRAEVANLGRRLEPVADKAALLTNLRQSVLALGGQLDGTRAEVVAERLQDFEQRMAGDLAEDLHQLHDVAEPVPITVADLPPDLRERYIGRNGKWLLRVFARESLWEFPALEQFTEQIRTVDADATGKPFGTVEGLKAMKNGLLRAGVYAFVVIAVVLLADFRCMRRTLVALAPLVAGVLLTVGVMGLFGVVLNPANMIAFPLILGVGVDNGVHVLHDFLLRRREGHTTISRAIGRGVLVKALTTMIGFGTLMLSTERGLVGLGFILTLGVGCSMLTALVFLPTALHVYSRRRPVAPPAAEEVVEPARLAA